MTLQAQNLAQRAVAAGRQVQDYVENNVKDSNIVNSARITVDAIRDSIDGSLSEATGAVADPVTEVATRAAEITSSPSSLLGAISSLFGFGAKKSNDLNN